MDPIKNPFSPGAGSPPQELVGRKAILEQARILFRRIKNKRSEKSLLLIGLRRAGKTVLLNEMSHLAKKEGYHVLFTEAQEGKGLGSLLIPYLQNLLFTLNRTLVSDKVKRGLAVLRSFIESLSLTIGDLTFGMGIEPERGSADSGDLEIDLCNLFIAIGEAAEDCKCPLAILIDEMQYFTQKELAALIVAMHKMQQNQLPLVLLGAGLPNLPGLDGEAKSYAERLFNFPFIGALSEKDAITALQEPAQTAGVTFTNDALKEIFRLTQGYPYFLQEWDYLSWNLANSSPITISAVQKATAAALPHLDQNFFLVRFDRLAPSEKNFLRKMADLGSGPYRAGDVAELLHTKVSHLSPIRAKLIKKGMIYSPSYGELAFTVPLFDEFMKRVMP